MIRCVILDDYQHVALRSADWSVLDADVVVHHTHFDTEESLLAAIADADVVVAMRERTAFPRALLAKLPRLKLLTTMARRNPSIDVRAAEELGITVCGTNSLDYPTSELTWGLILGLVRHIPQDDADMHRGGPWQPRAGIGLRGRTLGLLGLGRLGSEVAKVGQAFGMKTIAWSNNLNRERCEQCGVEHVSKDALIERSDVLSIHTQLSRRTEGIIDLPELRRMKRTAYLVNTSRGFIVREKALIEALETGLIAGAALDNYETEPLPLDHPLRSAPNLLLTPHTGAFAMDNHTLWYGQTVENIASWMKGVVIRRMDPAINVDRSQ